MIETSSRKRKRLLNDLSGSFKGGQCGTQHAYEKKKKGGNKKKRK